jgi:PqqD family protein of HPr-rel-A system
MLTKEKIRPNRLKDLMINDNGFAFDPRSGITYNLSPTGLDVVAWLKQGCDEDAIIERLIDKYDVAGNPARDDLQSFLSALRKYSLIDDTLSKTR